MSPYRDSPAEAAEAELARNPGPPPEAMSPATAASIQSLLWSGADDGQRQEDAA